VRQNIPLCPDIDNFFDDDSLGHNSQIFLNESSGELVVLFGTTFVGQMCLQKWDTATGEQLLAARLPENFALNSRVPGGITIDSSASPFAQFTPEQLTTTLQINEEDNQNPGVVKFDLSNGAIAFQKLAEEYDLAPIAEWENVIIVRAERKRGSKQHEIWGLDSGSGEQLWKHILQADYLYELDPFDDRYSVRMQPDGLVILQLLTDSEPSELVVQKLNAADGSLLYETETALTEDFWRGLTWANDTAYLALRNLVAVDLETGATAVEWP
jgi:hypothetical protein